MADDERRTVRGVPDAVWQAAAAAARRAGVPLGQWFCDAIDRAINAERQPLDLLVSPPLSDSEPGGADLADCSAALAAMASAHAAGLPVTAASAKDAVRVVRAKLREAGGMPALKGRGGAGPAGQVPRLALVHGGGAGPRGASVAARDVGP